MHDKSTIKILNRLGVVEGKLKQNIVEKGSLSNVNFLLHGNLHSDDNSSMLETIDFDVCEASIVSTALVNKQLNNGSESPLIENANSMEFADNLSRQGYDNNSSINSISNGRHGGTNKTKEVSKSNPQLVN